jgi:hypothetical protein
MLSLAAVRICSNDGLCGCCSYYPIAAAVAAVSSALDWVCLHQQPSHQQQAACQSEVVAESSRCQLLDERPAVF